MSEVLQGLLTKIKQEGLDQAEAEGARVVAAAREKAAAIVAEAEKRAADLRARAEADAQAFAERGRAAMEQAARDILISVGDRVRARLLSLVEGAAAQAVSGDSLRAVITQAVKAYIAQGGAPLEVIVSAEDRKRLADGLLADWRKEAIQGVELKEAAGLGGGFRVKLVNQQIEHDFTAPAIAAAMEPLLRAELGAIVKKAAAKK